MPLVFEVVFLIAVISPIEFIGVGVGGGGGLGAVGGLKQAFKHTRQCCAISRLAQPQGRPGLSLESVWHPMQSY